MADIQTTPKQFTTIAYVTKDGEKCTATKNNGIVTVQGDKNGVRQIPVEEFMKELAATLPKVDLARTPAQDTVQFKGGEEKTAEDSSVITEPNHKARNWAIGIGTTVATLIGLGVAGRHGYLGKGIQKFLGGVEKDAGKLADDLTGAAEHTNPHATTETSEISAQEFEQIVNRETDFVYGGTRTTGRTAEEAAADTAKPLVDVDKEGLTRVQSEFRQQEEAITTTTNKVEEAAPKPVVTPAAKPKSPIPESEILELPKDLELNPINILGGKYIQAEYTSTEILVSVRANNGIRRTYTLTPDKKAITGVLEYGPKEIRPFRQIKFKDGKPVSIQDFTVEGTRIRHLPKEKPVQPKPTQSPKPEAVQPQKTPEQLKKEEIARQQQLEDDLARQQRETERLRREQDEITNNEILNAAVLADMMSSAGRKTAEKASETASKGVDKMVEQMAKEADKAAETAAKADVPKAGTVLEETASAASKTEASAAETVVNSSEKAGDDLFAQNSTDGLFTPKASDELYTPGDGYLTSTEKLADDITPETTRTSLLDTPVDEVGKTNFSSFEDDLARMNEPIDNFGSTGLGDEVGRTNFSSFEDDLARMNEPIDNFGSTGLGDEFGRTSFNSFEDDLARIDDPIDSFGSSGFDDGFDFM